MHARNSFWLVSLMMCGCVTAVVPAYPPVDMACDPVSTCVGDLVDGLLIDWSDQTDPGFCGWPPAPVASPPQILPFAVPCPYQLP